MRGRSACGNREIPPLVILPLVENAIKHGIARSLPPGQAHRERLGTVRLPAPGQYGMMGYLHEGRQYVVVQIASGTVPGSLVALRRPASSSP